MSRDVDVSHLNIDETTCEIFHFGKSGEVIEGRDEKASSIDFNSLPRTYAIMQESSRGDKSSKDFWILINRGEIVDPHGADAHMSILGYKLCNFQKVGNSCFDHYTAYLKTKRKSSYTKSRRTLTSR